MKALEKIKRLAERIDEMTLRERAMVFAAAALIVVTLINTLFLDPLLARQKQLSEQVVQQQERMKAIRVQIESLVQARGEDPNSANRARLAQIRRQLSEAETFLQGKQDGLVPPEKIADLLERMLQHNRRLQLLALKTLPVSSLLEDVKDAKDEKAAEGVPGQLVYKHGVELTVRGGYLDLMNYLVELERLPEHMYWGRASLSVETYPAATLTLTLYTLSMDKTWLTV
ncbi:MAG: type II secretion system protein GspM [Pseudomonadota bacterium]